jgi:phosphohistidine phosphatase
MLRRLIFMRHAEAQMTQYGKPDKDRAITMEGMNQLEALRLKLKGKLSGVDYVICSNARRTRQTLEGIKPLMPANVEVVFDDSLHQGDQNLIWKLIGDVDQNYKGVLMIAHNPGLSQVVQWVADLGGRSIRQIPTGGLALCSTKSNWSDISAPKIALDEFIQP